jgi:hypothetical protein
MKSILNIFIFSILIILFPFSAYSQSPPKFVWEKNIEVDTNIVRNHFKNFYRINWCEIADLKKYGDNLYLLYNMSIDFKIFNTLESKIQTFLLICNL